MKPRVLIVDDDPTVVRFLEAACDEHASSVCYATHPAELMAKLVDGVDLILLDLMMPELNGMDLLREFAGEVANFPPVVLVSRLDGAIVETSMALARKLGFRVHGSLAKPISLADIDALFAGLAHERRESGTHAALFAEGVAARALAAGAFYLAYQPQIRLRDGRAVGVEALVRWNDPELGQVPPNAFVPILESNGHALALALYVIERALADWSIWQPDESPLSLSINISGDVIRHAGFADEVLQRIHARGIEPERICLEMTESALVVDDVATLQALVRLRMYGVRFSIDDFGTGHSTLAQLRRMPVTEIKLDRSYVKLVAHSAKSLAIVEGMLKIAVGMGAEVVAEGVEDEEVSGVLRDLHCAMAQGFFYARPMAPEALRDWLAQQPLAKP